MKSRRAESHDDKVNQMKLLDIAAAAGSLGFTLFACICAGAAAGHVADSALGTAPWGMVLLSLVGAVAGFLSLYRKVLRLNECGNTGKKKSG